MSSAISEFSGGTELLYGAELLWEIKRKGYNYDYEESGSYSIGTFSQYSAKYSELVFLTSYTNTSSSDGKENHTYVGYDVIPMALIAHAIDHFNYVEHIESKIAYQKRVYLGLNSGYFPSNGMEYRYSILVNLPDGTIDASTIRNTFAQPSNYNYGILKMYGKV